LAADRPEFGQDGATATGKTAASHRSDDFATSVSVGSGPRTRSRSWTSNPSARQPAALRRPIRT